LPAVRLPALGFPALGFIGFHEWPPEFPELD
jgi:hypothetical protein